MIAAGSDTRRRGHAAALGAAGWLGLAATPTSAVMALPTWVSGGRSDIICAAAQEMSPLSGMAPMYALMSVVHSAPWLRLVLRRS